MEVCLYDVKLISYTLIMTPKIPKRHKKKKEFCMRTVAAVLMDNVFLSLVCMHAKS